MSHSYRARLLGTAALIAPIIGLAPSPASAGAPVTCHGLAATIVGTSAGETIVGTDHRDVIAALGGDDRVEARAGNDVVCGGRGADRLLGGTGNDLLLGQRGRIQQEDEFRVYIGNLLDGGPGNDRLSAGQRSHPQYPQLWPPNRVAFGSATGGVTVNFDQRTAYGPGVGHDLLIGQFRRLIGSPFNDTFVSSTDLELFGQGGDDRLTLRASAGADMFGSTGNDVITYAGKAYGQAEGGPGNDRMTSHRAYSRLEGGVGADVVRAGAGVDYVLGDGADKIWLGDGNDQVEFFASRGVAPTYAGLGRDKVIVFPNAGADIVADLKAGTLTINGVHRRMASAESFESATLAGGTHVMRLVVLGTDGPNQIDASFDRFDTLRIDGRGGADDIDLFATDDATSGARVLGGGGNDSIDGTPAADVLLGGAGDDTIDGWDGNDVCAGEHLESCEAAPAAHR